jgi:predicted transcriptional regulator
MNPKITEEQRQALIAGHGEAQVEDDQTHNVYVIVEKDAHEQTLQALREQDIAAIQAGIEDMEAGRTVSLEEAAAEIRKELGFPPRTT